MGIRYEHITIEERCEISRLRSSGHSIRQVAATLDRSPSTISRELKRNVSQSQGYWPKYADQQAQERRWCGSRLERDEGLRRRVLARLQQGLVASAGCRTLCSGAGKEGDLPREHLPVYLRPTGPDEGLLVAPLPAQGQVETGLAGTQRGQSGVLHGSPAPCGGTSSRGC